MSDQNAKNLGTPLAYNVVDAAKLLGIGHNTARALIASGELHHRRVGRRILVPRTALEAYLDVGTDRAA